jgi:hypothetical protein
VARAAVTFPVVQTVGDDKTDNDDRDYDGQQSNQPERSSQDTFDLATVFAHVSVLPVGEPTLA